jgi:hypothetical protein
MSRSKRKYIPEFFVVSRMYWLKQPNQSLIALPTKDIAKRKPEHIPMVIRSLSPLMFIKEHECENVWDYLPTYKVLEFFSLTHNRNVFVEADKCVFLKQMQGQYERLTDDATKTPDSD